MDIRHKLGLQVLRIWSWDAERWVAVHCLLKCVESGGGDVPVCPRGNQRRERREWVSVSYKKRGSNVKITLKNVGGKCFIYSSLGTKCHL